MSMIILKDLKNLKSSYKYINNVLRIQNKILLFLKFLYFKQ